MSRVSGYGVLSLVLLPLVAMPPSACSPRSVSNTPFTHGFKPVEFHFDTGPASPFAFKFKDAVGDGRDRLLVLYDRYDRISGKSQGRFFRISRDGGETFGREHSSKEVSAGRENVEYHFRFIHNGLAVVYASDRNIYYTRSDDGGGGWSQPSQINDEQSSSAAVSWVQGSENDVYCVWEDNRRGFSLIYFSSSQDGGRRWKPNQPVEYDFLEGNQSRARLVLGANRRLIAIWEDWRDRQTLVDIRSSYSDDGGDHWSLSKRVNDDREHVWQSDFAMASMNGNIYVVFQDFREPGEEGDNDWNIYFARSQDNGTNWSGNVRVNDIKEGADTVPALTIDEQGILYCAWSSCRDNIFGDVVVSASADGGRSWSRSSSVSETDEVLTQIRVKLIPVAPQKLLCVWLEENYLSSQYRLSWLERLAAPDQNEGRNTRALSETALPLQIETENTLFADDFSAPVASPWQVTAGSWMIVNDSWMGIAPGHEYFSSFARLAEPESFVMTGRFRLDPVSHIMAYLYFRADPSRSSYYVIGNYFRRGVWLGMSEEPSSLRPQRQLNSRVLEQSRFPFQNDRWYKFKLVVTPEQIDYYVDDRLMLIHQGKLALPRSRIGLGGLSRAPTYFDDIVVSDIKR